MPNQQKLNSPKRKIIGFLGGHICGLVKGATLYKSEKEHLKDIVDAFPATEDKPINILLTHLDLNLDALMGENMEVSGVLRNEPSEVVQAIFSIHSENIKQTQ